MDDVSQLRDMISKAVSDQFQLHQIRKEHDLQENQARSGSDYRTNDDQLEEELAKINTE